MAELKKDYGVFGDYGYTSETLLFETNSVNEAIQWAQDYTEDGFGGYSVIEVGYFLSDGTYETAWRADADDWTDELEESYLYDEF